MSIPWAELLKNRRPSVGTRNSAHMLDCMKVVLAAHSKAVIQAAAPGYWRLMLDGLPISNPHNSQYACWEEAREVMHESDK
jgi:hypothetical protein